MHGTALGSVAGDYDDSFFLLFCVGNPFPYHVLLSIRNYPSYFEVSGKAGSEEFGKLGGRRCNATRVASGQARLP